MVNIRGKMEVNQFKEKLPFDDIKTLNECCDCEGCLCEDFCEELEEKYFGKGGE